MRPRTSRFIPGISLAPLGVLAGIASAKADVVFDFGLLTPSPDAICATDCVLPTPGTHTVTIGSQTVAATGYSDQFTTAAFLTQKPGPFGPETGLGESDTAPSPSDSEFEIAPGKSVVLDNTAVGAPVVSISIGSLQEGESAAIYTGASLASLSLFTTVTGLPDARRVDLTSTTTAFVGVLEISGNSSVLQEVVASNVSEPASVTLLAGGLFGLGMIRRRMTT